MSEETSSPQTQPATQPDGPEIPPAIHPPTPTPVAPKPRLHWLRRSLVCNPFYLVSAALLLFGIYRVSCDTSVLVTEQSQLAFNFSALQFYEVLLVFTAIVLARRAIWYDATLLATLESAFLFIPFFLISQAALIDRNTVWGLSLLAVVVAVMRFAGLKRFFAELHLPGRLLGIGAMIAIANAAMPIVYRTLHQSKIGTKVAAGAAYMTNECAWLLLLPALVALINFLPHPEARGNLAPQRRWIPAGFLGLWLAATTVHLYSLGYVYDFDLRCEWVAPVLWVLAWTMVRRAAEFPIGRVPAVSCALLVMPAAITLVAATGSGSRVFLALTLANILGYGALAVFRRGERFALHLCFASSVALLAGTPDQWPLPFIAGWTHGKCALLVVAAYGIAWAGMLRDPRLTILAGSLIVSGGFAVVHGDPLRLHWVIQLGFIFVLLHSYRWQDEEHQGAGFVRAAAAAAWVTHAWIWSCSDASPWLVGIPGLVVLAAAVSLRVIEGRWRHILIPAAAVLTVLAKPANAAAGQVRTAPDGLLLVVGSFILFGIGTVLALTRHRWHAK